MRLSASTFVFHYPYISTLPSPNTVTLWAAIKQVQRSALETGVSFKDYGETTKLRVDSKPVEHSSHSVCVRSATTFITPLQRLGSINSRRESGGGV